MAEVWLDSARLQFLLLYLDGGSAAGAGSGGGSASGSILVTGPLHPGSGVGAGVATGSASGVAYPTLSGTASGAGVGGGSASGTRIVEFTSSSPALFEVTAAAGLEARLTPAVPAGRVVRTQPSVTVTVPTPAIILGQPRLPHSWGRMESTFTESDGAYTVTYPPPPIITIPPRPPGSTGTTGPGGLENWVWRAEDVSGASGASVSSWPEKDGGPAWTSHGIYRPTVEQRSVATSHGRVYLQDKVVITNYRHVQHMYIDLGQTFDNPFTWIMAGIILSYPTARYGHYLIDQGSTPGGRNEARYGFTYPLNQTTHRSALLFQRTSAIASTTYKIEGNPMARSEHNYTPQPRMFWGVFNGASSQVGVWGRNYKRTGRGTVQNKNQRLFVMGRRANYTSTDLASHLAIFEVRFFPFNLSGTHLEQQYGNLAAKYDFAKYRI